MLVALSPCYAATWFESSLYVADWFWFILAICARWRWFESWFVRSWVHNQLCGLRLDYIKCVWFELWLHKIFRFTSFLYALRVHNQLMRFEAWFESWLHIKKKLRVLAKLIK